MDRDPSPQPFSSRSGGQRIWIFGNCSLDEANRVLMVGGQVAELEAKPLDLLLELLQHAGEVVTKDELLDAVWPNVTVSEGSLTTALSKLRKTIRDVDGAAIVTVPRIGSAHLGGEWRLQARRGGGGLQGGIEADREVERRGHPATSPVPPAPGKWESWR